ncbi:hypothetical protein OCHUTO_0790 [Orientia chuto str. Dubai]|uniref:Acetyltransferase domain protein n=1 Tax=Orientia chuto str. Dubai TaxID=1359168 RepID=A0A0F3MLW1_9RICK|nr:hypothetical protein [Candidatus Orientia mediorientalis]KJV55564.1 hypothetical protein OCHUTO_0790 [Orientia chuto str. Dubai]
MIDSNSANPKAKHVYMKARFKHVCDFIMEGTLAAQAKCIIYYSKFDPTISIINATMHYYSCIQNIARFYVYDLSRECGSISSDWARPEDGLYESFDFKSYFIDPSRKAFLVKVYDEIAGFVLLNQATEDSTNTWNMGEFFIIAKFKSVSIATRVAKEIWNMHPGKWKFLLSLIISQP